VTRRFPAATAFEDFGAKKKGGILKFNMSFDKKLFVAVLKSCVYIAVYMLLGLLLALFINNAVRAA
jgi:hypothetical protein